MNQNKNKDEEEENENNNDNNIEEIEDSLDDESINIILSYFLIVIHNLFTIFYCGPN